MKIQEYWEGVTRELCTILNYEVPSNFIIMYLGLIPEDMVQANDVYLYKICLIAAKKGITRKWLKVDPPTVNSWLAIIQEICDMERLTHSLRLQQPQFNKKWTKWMEYQRHNRDT